MRAAMVSVVVAFLRQPALAPTYCKKVSIIPLDTEDEHAAACNLLLLESLSWFCSSGQGSRFAGKHSRCGGSMEESLYLLSSAKPTASEGKHSAGQLGRAVCDLLLAVQRSACALPAYEDGAWGGH